MNRFAVSVVLVFAAAACGGRVTASNGLSRPPSTGRPTPSLPSAVRDRVTQLAAMHGDAQPVSADYVVTTRRAAEQLSVAEPIADDTVVYLVDVHGSGFFNPRAGGLSTAPTRQTSSHLVFTLDPTDLKVLDLGTPDTGLDLTPLGPVGHI